MKLFQFTQMVSTVPKFDWSCFIYPIKTVGICTIICKFKWSACILPKLELHFLKFSKIE